MWSTIEAILSRKKKLLKPILKSFKVTIYIILWFTLKTNSFYTVKDKDKAKDYMNKQQINNGV